MSRNITDLVVCAIIFGAVFSLIASALASHETIFDTPVFDMKKTAIIKLDGWDII